MSNVFSLLALLILIIGILLLRRIHKIRLTAKISSYLMLAYCVVLLLSALAVPFLTSDSLIKIETDTDLKYTQANEAAANLIELAKHGQLDNSPGIYKNASLSFPFQGKSLGLASNDPSSSILIERTSPGSNQIEVSSYITTFLTQGVDITQKVLPPDIKLEGNILSIHAPSPYTISFISFKPDFTAAQFTEKKTSNPAGNLLIFGRQAIYLRIPRDLRIDTGLSNITYLD
jgi:hypothetical protein